MNERRYQADLIKTIRLRIPDCVIIKNDSGYMQGVPDLLILCRDRWAMLEVKASEDAAVQPNQEYYIELLGEMSFAAFIYPENEEDVLDELQRSLTARRAARVPQR